MGAKKIKAARVTEMRGVTNGNLAMTLGDLLGSNDALTELSKARLPAPTAFKIGVLVSRIVPEMAVGHEAKLALFKKYGTESNGQVTVAIEKMPEFEKELAVLLATEVILPVSPLPMSMFTGELTITPAHVRALLPFIDQEGKE